MTSRTPRDAGPAWRSETVLRPGKDDMAPREPSEECREVFALLSDYLNLELPPDICKAVENHLSGCAPCIAFTESLRKTVELLRRYEPSERPKRMDEQQRKELLQAYGRMLRARGA